MERRGLKPAQIARANRIPLTTLCNWMQGQTPRNLDHVKTVADFFEVSVDYLLFGVEPKWNGGANQTPIEVRAGLFELILKPIKRGGE